MAKEQAITIKGIRSLQPTQPESLDMLEYQRYDQALKAIVWKRGLNYVKMEISQLKGRIDDL